MQLASSISTFFNQLKVPTTHSAITSFDVWPHVFEGPRVNVKSLLV